METSSNRIRWVSTGRFNLTISPAPDGSTTIACNAPEAERNAWYRKGHSVEAGPDESLTPDEALEQSHEWLEAHQLEYEDDLAEFPRIGAATRITSRSNTESHRERSCRPLQRSSLKSSMISLALLEVISEKHWNTESTTATS